MARHRSPFAALTSVDASTADWSAFRRSFFLAAAVAAFAAGLVTIYEDHTDKCLSWDCLARMQPADTTTHNE